MSNLMFINLLFSHLPIVQAKSDSAHFFNRQLTLFYQSKQSVYLSILPFHSLCRFLKLYFFLFKLLFQIQYLLLQLLKTSTMTDLLLYQVLFVSLELRGLYVIVYPLIFISSLTIEIFVSMSIFFQILYLLLQISIVVVKAIDELIRFIKEDVFILI